MKCRGAATAVLSTLGNARHRCCRWAAHAEGHLRVRGRCGDCSRHGTSMRTFAVLALIALVASCRLDTFFVGSGGRAAPVAGPPADLRFADEPQTTRARNTLPPVRVTVRDDQGNIVAGFGGLVSLALDANNVVTSLGDSTTVPAANGVATFRHLRIDKAGTGYRLVASAPGTALAPVRSQPFNIIAPSTGSLTVTTTTSGSNLPSGYTITVDDSISQPIGINAVVTFVGLAAGSHAVRLDRKSVV